MSAKLEEYVTRVVAAAPLLSQEQLDHIAVILRPGGDYIPPVTASAASIRASKITKAELELERLHDEMLESMSGCRGCGLSRNVHEYQAGHGSGYHKHEPMTPDQTIEVARAYKKKIKAAEKELENVRV